MIVPYVLSVFILLASGQVNSQSVKKQGQKIYIRDAPFLALISKDHWPLGVGSIISSRHILTDRSFANHTSLKVRVGSNRSSNGGVEFLVKKVILVNQKHNSYNVTAAILELVKDIVFSTTTQAIKLADIAYPEIADNTTMTAYGIKNGGALNKLDFTKYNLEKCRKEFRSFNGHVDFSNSWICAVSDGWMPMQTGSPLVHKGVQVGIVHSVTYKQRDFKLILLEKVKFLSTGIQDVVASGQHKNLTTPSTPETTTSQPTTPELKTTEPTTLKPTTVKPTTVKQSTVKPTTVKPTTPRPTTPEPTTLKPTTSTPNSTTSVETSTSAPSHTSTLPATSTSTTVSTTKSSSSTTPSATTKTPATTTKTSSTTTASPATTTSTTHATTTTTPAASSSQNLSESKVLTTVFSLGAYSVYLLLWG